MKWLKRTVTGGLATIHMTFMLACSDVPKPYQVGAGLDPTYQDEDVRFRTTYYMRVYELCTVDDGGDSSREYEARYALTSLKKGVPRIVKDSLYRFRMTGQSSALYSNLHFESGVLGAHEIDAFGSTINYDAENAKFTIPDNATSGASPSTPADRAQEGWCPNGSAAEKKFFLLGPQGVRTLNLNDRLVMAMYTDSKPLIGALKRLSNQQSAEITSAQLPFALDTSIARANKSLSVIQDAQMQMETISPQETITRLLPLFGAQAESSSSIESQMEKPIDESKIKTTPDGTSLPKVQEN